MSRMWCWITGKGQVEVENPTTTQIATWIGNLDGKQRDHIHFEVPIGQLSIFGGIGDSGRIKLPFTDRRTNRGGLIYDPQDEYDSRLISISDNSPISEPIEIGLTLTKERAFEILVYLLEHQKFPKGLKWRGGNLNEY